MLTLNCHTIKEIAHQPQMWMDTYDIVCRRKDDIAAFFKKNGINKESRIILTGAGTSAFIADTSECIFVKDGYHNAKAVSTTDIVSTPESFLSPDDTLFISSDVPETALKVSPHIISPASSARTPFILSSPAIPTVSLPRARIRRRTL